MTTLTKEQMIKGEWYHFKNEHNEYIGKFEYWSNNIGLEKVVDIIDGSKHVRYFLWQDYTITPAPKELVKQYFPDEFKEEVKEEATPEPKPLLTAQRAREIALSQSNEELDEVLKKIEEAAVNKKVNLEAVVSEIIIDRLREVYLSYRVSVLGRNDNNDNYSVKISW